MRSCGQCSMCCLLLPIAEFEKPSGKWCTHCDPGGAGCKIYEERPKSCADWLCGWLGSEQVPDFMAPLKSHVVLDIDAEGTGVLAYVHPKRPDAWKKRDVHAYLRQLSHGRTVIVHVGRKAIQIMPSGDDEVPPERIVRDGISTGVMAFDYPKMVT